MNLLLRGPLAAAVATLSFQAAAAATVDLPPVKVSDENAVATCATPGRLMAYIRAKNPKLAPKFDVIATEYMRHGETLGLRWDYAFFQMLVETGFLTYTGDVKPEQNNFAGLGATGRGARGESFKDVSSGARAHLEHLLMYSGEKIENPVAERTRNIQDWGVLTSWQKTIKGPMTFTQLAKQWAPTTRSYPSDIKAVADRFFNGPCKDGDPNPELVTEARAGKTGSDTKTASAAPAAPTKGDELAKRAIEDGRKEAALPSGLGAGPLAAAADAAKPAGPKVTILNAQPETAPANEPSGTGPANDTAKAVAPEAKVETAALTGTMPAKSGPPAKTGKASKADPQACRVFTASYGGTKAIIVKATADKLVNYTVLDVNEGTEKREADAYIAAYAQGGETVGEFPNQDQALNKAFELCPEG